MNPQASHLFRAVLTSFLVGTALTTGNQWAALVGDAPFAIGQAALAFVAPLVVALAISFLTSQQLEERTDTAQQNEPCIIELGKAFDVLEEIEGNARRVNSASKARAAALVDLIETARDLQASLKGASADVEDNNVRLKQACEVVRDMDASTQRVLARLETGHASSVELATAVENLVSSAQEVETASTSISDISRKTEMLAVNALIEANRAGEIGRGFAVVASQVGDLSSRTNQVVSEISEKTENQRMDLDDAQATLKRMLEHLIQSKVDSEGSLKSANRVREDVEGSATVAASVADVMSGQASEFDSIVEFLVQVQKDTEAAVKGSATNISLAQAAKKSVQGAMPGGETPETAPTSIAVAKQQVA